MNDDILTTVLTVARSAQRFSYWQPGDWPDLAVELLLAGVDDPEIAELAGLPASLTGWDTDPLVASLWEKHDVPALDDEGAVTLLAGLMATDLQIRPATVSAPMIRLVARLALLAPESDRANRCYRCAEYLDCDCVPVDSRLETELETELENLTPLDLPAGVAQVLARPLRLTLPAVQPPRSH